MKQIIFLLFLLSCTAVYAQQQDSVTIHGRVTDYNGQPIDSASVWWQNPQFNDIIEAITDKDGQPAFHGNVRIGGQINRGCTLIFSFGYTGRVMPVFVGYGLRAFCIPGAMPTYQIYVRPMSLTRTYQWMKETKPESLVHGENLSDIEQQEQNKEARECQMAPRPGQLKVTVWIDGEKVPVLMKQEIKEYFDSNEYGNAYLLTVDMPKHPKKDLPYRIFKVELEDMENGDRGEGLYYMEKENYVQ